MTKKRDEPGSSASAVSARIYSLVDEEFGLGTFEVLGGSWRSLFLRGPPAEQDRVLDILALGLCRHLKLFSNDLPLRAARADEAGYTRADEKRHSAKVGLMLASSDMDRPQTIRLGEKWVVGEDGREALVRPDELLLVKPFIGTRLPQRGRPPRPSGTEVGRTRLEMRG